MPPAAPVLSPSLNRTPMQCWLTAVFSALAAVVLSGCGQGDSRGYPEHLETLFPVTGKVLFEGKPAKNATVVLYRSGSNSSGDLTHQDPLQEPNPHGECDETGTFRIYTYAAYDGAPSGRYRVSVSWRDPEGRARDSETYPELLPQRYVRPETSGLIVDVAEQENQLAPFELQR